ncbi:MAG TPA: hypothetical protein VMD59_12240, partial [Acidimicrobiales bacterium]|nr:hypothetical protein [Acidimicrobiales bacterium]
MRHDFATVVQMVVPDEDSAAALVAAVPADSEFLLRRGDEDLALAEPFVGLVVRAVEVIASGRNVVVLSTDDLKTLAETEELLDLPEMPVRYWMKIGWLEDYGTIPEHRIPLGAIRKVLEFEAEEHHDLTTRRLPGFDDESAQCRWTSVVELLESARAEGQLLARAFEQGAAVVVRSA